MNRLITVVLCVVILISGCGAPTHSIKTSVKSIKSSQDTISENVKPWSHTSAPGPSASASLNPDSYMSAGPQGSTSPGPWIAASYRSGNDVWVSLGAPWSHSVLVYHNTDKGTSWTSTKLTIPGQDSAYRILMAAAGASVWVLVGGEVGAHQETWYLFRAVNGDAPWHALPQEPSRFIAGDVSGLTFQFTSTESGWLIFNVPILDSETIIVVLHTINGGQTWTQSTLRFQPYWGNVSISGPVVAGPEELEITIKNQASPFTTKTFLSSDDGATWH